MSMSTGGDAAEPGLTEALHEIVDDDSLYPEAPSCCGPHLLLWGDVDCCDIIALPSRIDVNKTLRASVNFSSAVNAKAELHDDVSALSTGAPASAANSDTMSDSDGNVDARSDSDQSTTMLQEQAHALGYTAFTFRWKLVGYRGMARGHLRIVGDVVGDFSCLGDEGSVKLTRLQAYDTTQPIPAQFARADGRFIDSCGDRAFCTVTLVRSGG